MGIIPNSLKFVKQHIKKRLDQESFHPELIGILTNPFYFARRGLSKNIERLSSEIQGKVLDVGCGTQPYRQFFSQCEYHGLELDTPENRSSKIADSFYDGKVLPFAENSFDSLVISQVLEHIFEPDRFLDEAHRVLKPGGRLLLTVPFLWDEHEQPFDYARYSSFGIVYLLEKHQYSIIESHKSVCGIQAIVQIWNAYLYKATLRNSRLWNLIMALLLMAPGNILGILLSWILPQNSDIYLDNIILAKAEQKTHLSHENAAET